MCLFLDSLYATVGKCSRRRLGINIVFRTICEIFDTLLSDSVHKHEIKYFASAFL